MRTVLFDVLANPWGKDSNASTLNGSIAIRDLTSSGVGFEQLRTLTPESIPQSIDFVDFNGDGLPEHVVPSGELTKGIFIGGYHKILIDLENDSNPEIVVEGYAGTIQHIRYFRQTIQTECQHSSWKLYFG